MDSDGMDGGYVVTGVFYFGPVTKQMEAQNWALRQRQRQFYFYLRQCVREREGEKHYVNMDEEEFCSLLELFPVVRPRDYHIDLDPSKQSTSRAAENEIANWQNAWEEGDKRNVENERVDPHDAFWEKLKLAAERKVGAAEAERFCRAFQQVHKKLVYEELSLDAANKLIRRS
ncbi:hypothetical protein CFOL_v3_05673 [Cephalotus follicularis]|uniref:Uncharacterized protein n=1 Tax=Cephalotus follicularis TaxID=3775 RepID=A0A1Q3B2F9_CEPFO|nr:hypothetical protein CFOL_v3_05673 [Cephalotus follicularis]